MLFYTLLQKGKGSDIYILIYLLKNNNYYKQWIILNNMGKQSLLNALKNWNLKDRFSSLEEVSKDFVKHNNLPKPAKVQETDKGLILDFGETGLVILSSKSSERLPKCNWLNSYIGRNGSHMYTSDEVIYTLSGRLNGKRISLEAEVSYTEDYKMEKHGPPEFLPTPVATGNDKKYVFRKDNEPYWFLEKARKH